MKSRSILLFAILLLPLLSSTGQSPVLQFNPLQGNEYRLLVSTSQEVTQVMMGNTQTITSTLVNRYRFRVSGEVNGILVMEVKYDSIALKTVMPDGMIEGSTGDYSRKNAVLSKVLREILKSSLRIKVSRLGEVVAVTGLDTTFLSVVDSFTNMPEQVRTLLRTALQEKFGMESLRYQLNAAFAIYPAKSPKHGKWGNEVKLGPDDPARAENEWTIIEEQPGNSQLKLEGRIGPPEGNDFIQVNGIPMKYVLNGTQSGEITLATASGWPLKGTVSQSIKGTVQLKGTPAMTAGISWPISIESRIAYEGGILPLHD